MKQELKALMIGLLLIGVLGQPALADMGNRDHGLSPEELAFVFGDPNADGFEILSPQEMAEIEGEYGWVTVLRYISYIRSLRPILRYDSKPHRFPSSWGPLQGNRPHIHIGFYRKGIKGSRVEKRIPAGPRTSWGSHKR